MRIRKAPKAEDAYLVLKEQIVAGHYPKGVLPVEPELAEQLQVSRKTLRSALSRLALENLVVRVKGKGTFVNTGERTQGKILVVVRNNEHISLPDRYILPGIQQEASNLNLQVETCTQLSLVTRPKDEVVHRIRQKDYLGILSLENNFLGDEPTIGVLKGTGLPVLLPHAYPGDDEKTGFAAMGSDYRKVIRDGLQYLVKLGHRRIACLTYQDFRIDRKNYFQILEELGLDMSPELYQKSSSYMNHDLILAAIRKLFDSTEKRPTAIFCFSDYFALCLYEYLEQHQIRIPEDLAVLSTGGMIGCDFLTPPLSAIDFDCLGIGRAAVRNLMEMRQKNEFTRPFAITPHFLTERESTRKPPRSTQP